MCDTQRELLSYNKDDVKIKKLSLLNSYKKKRLHQAYLFSGNEGIGKATFAYSFARFLLSNIDLDSFDIDKNNKACRLIESNTHPDLLVIEPNTELLPLLPPAFVTTPAPPAPIAIHAEPL